MTDRHDREVEIVNGMDGDRGGNRGILPLLVRLADKDSRNDKTETDNPTPKPFCSPGLKKQSWKEFSRIIFFKKDYLKTL